MTDATRLYEEGRWKEWVIPGIALCTIIVCFQVLHNGSNNMMIFRYSSLHLLAHQPLYELYPTQYNDYFLYYPAFPVLFLPFAFLPASISVVGWTLLSGALYIIAVERLPGLSAAGKKMMLVLVLPELLNNLQYVQTNILLSSLMLLAFISFEKKQVVVAALFAALAFCIKGYGGIIGLLFLLYPHKGKFIGWGLFWGLLLSALPLCFVSFQETVELYRSWLHMIGSDTIRENLSLIGRWGNTHEDELWITGAGILLLAAVLVATLVQRSKDSLPRRALVCSFLFVWVVLFNRAAESPTYQLAITGIAYWLVLQGANRYTMFIAAIFLCFTYLLPSDLSPPLVHRIYREHAVKLYAYTACFAGLLATLSWPTRFVFFNPVQNSHNPRP